MQALSIQRLAPEVPRLHVDSDNITTDSLANIDSVSVVADADDPDSFILEVYLRTQHRMASQLNVLHESAIPQPHTSSLLAPTRSLHKSVPQALPPDIRLVRSYADFLALKTQVLQRVHVAHGIVPCSFCREVSSAAVWGGTHSSPLAMLAMTQKRHAAVFLAFVSELLELTRAPIATRRARSCTAQHDVPQLLRAFLPQ